MILHILVSGDGEYSDRSEIPIAAYASEAEADRVCAALNALCEERLTIYRARRKAGVYSWSAAATAVEERAAALLPEGRTLQSDYCVMPVPVIE